MSRPPRPPPPPAPGITYRSKPHFESEKDFHLSESESRFRKEVVASEASIGRGLIVLARVLLVLGVVWFVWDAHNKAEDRKVVREIVSPYRF